MARSLVGLLLLLACKESVPGRGAGGDASGANLDGGAAGADGASLADASSRPTDVPVGGPCASSDECDPGGLDPLCAPEEDGFPGGYCTATGCSVSEQDCPGGPSRALCIPGDEGTFCLARCDPDGDACREGYGCVPVAAAGACLPVDEDAEVGDACEGFAECGPGMACLREEDFGLPGGTCVAFCAPPADTECPGDSQCVRLGMEGEGICLDGCEIEGDCREEYTCRRVGSRRVCVARFDPDDLGEPCDGPVECVGGTCAREEESGWPRGVCLYGPCSVVLQDCPGDGACVPGERGGGFCVAGCDREGECRDGYACEDGACLPSCEEASQCASGCCDEEDGLCGC